MSRKVSWICLLSWAIALAGFSVTTKAQENPATALKPPNQEIVGGEHLPHIILSAESRARIRFDEYRNSYDRDWETPIGVVAHHRTFGVTYSGDIGYLPECQHGSYVNPGKGFSWVSGLKGVFHDAIGMAVGNPTSFWGTGEKLNQRLLEGNLPVVISRGSSSDLDVEETAFATLPGGEIISHVGNEPILAYIRVRVKNPAQTERDAAIWVWRSSPVPEIGEVGGLTRKFEPVRLVGSKVIGDSGYCHLIFFPRHWDLTFDTSADSNDLRYFGRLSTKLGPGETKDFWYIYPFWPLTKEVADSVGKEEFEEMLTKVAGSWKSLYSQGMTISVPDEKISQAFDIGVANTLFLAQRLPWGIFIFDSQIFPSRGRPDDYWGTIRLGGYNTECEDSVQKAIVHSLLQTGHFDYARETLDGIFHAQSLAQPHGSFSQKGCLSGGNTTAMTPNCCIWASGTGYTLWAAAEYYKYTHDADWIRNHREQILAGLEWIKTERHRWDFWTGYDGLLRGQRVCDSHDTGYHPYNDAMSYWGMKDVVGVLVSLGLAGNEWQDEVRDYEARIKTVYEKDDLRAYAWRSGEYGLGTGAALMSGLYSIDSPIGKKLAAGAHAGWYGMYHGLFAIEEGDNDRFLDQYYNLMATHMSHQTHANGEWPDIAFTGETSKSLVNLQPHSHSNAGFHFMTRAMLAYEDDASIHLMRGIPSWWLTQSTKNIEVRQAPMISGPMSFTASRVHSEIKVLIDLPTPAPDKTIKVYFPLPAGSRLGRVQLNGEPWKQFDPVKSLVSFSGRSGRVEVLADLE